MNRHILPYLLLFGWMMIPAMLLAQPPNDNCANAEILQIPAAGYGFGLVYSDTISLVGASTEFGEQFPSGVPNFKSVWYRFSLPTTREVIILLDQPPATPMAPNEAGWSLYKTNGCLPDPVLDLIDPPIFNIEGFTHACLRKGDYLIQVGANITALDSIFIQLTVGPSTANEVLYDFTNDAFDFQVISGPTGVTNSYEVGCQSVYDGELLCPDSSFSKSTWHVFTTDNLVDYIRFEVDEEPYDILNLNNRTFGYQLYEGDIRLGPASTTLIDGCDTLIQTSPSNYGASFYACELQPNTTYSVQLLFETEYFGTIETRMYELGSVPTNGPDPSNLPPGHQLGVLTLGSSYSITDVFSCNARTSLYTCPPIVEDSTYINSDPYDLNWWATFELAAQQTVEIDISNNYSQPTSYFRVFQGNAADSCNLTLVGTFNSGGPYTLPCLEAGVYSVQVLGEINLPAWPYYTTHLGASATLEIDLVSLGYNPFTLNDTANFDSINALNPMVPGTQYEAQQAIFDCQTSPMPPGDSCFFSYYGYNQNDRAMYRIVYVDQDGIISVGGGNWTRFRYKLFAGNASTLPVVNGIITGLTDLTCCQSTYWNFKVCVSPGYYTLVTYGDVNDINYTDDPWIQFDTFPPTSFTNPLMPEVMDTLSLTNTTIGATATNFTCIENPDTILGYAPCNDATKLIYREFYLADSASLDFDDLTNHFTNSLGDVRYRLFAGRVSDGSVNSLVRDCFYSFDMSSCDFLQEGWYTVVAYGDGESYSDPAYCTGNGGSIGDLNDFQISINPPYPDPIYNTFPTAENVNGGNPVEWKPIYSAGHTAAIPKNDTIYVLGTDYFNCVPDAPFEAGVTGCQPSDNRVSYRVFDLGKPSYVNIYNIPYYTQAKLYQGDITQSSPPYTLEEDCFSTNMSKCMSPGTYTLAIFGGDAAIGYSITPYIYVDSVGVSKYDSASNAYDFGLIPNDSVEYFAAPGAPLDALGRPESNDFIFCTTEAFDVEPVNNCAIGSQTIPYSTTNLNDLRQNLWYTFEVSGPGQVDVSVYPLTPGKVSRLPFTVYRMPNYSAFPPIDSIEANLEFIDNSICSYYCWCHTETISFYRDPCAGLTTDRYVVVVYRNDYSNSPSYWPNAQLQVGVRFDDDPNLGVAFDHYSQANIITGNPTTDCNPPYNPQVLTTGTYTGCEGDLTCATKDPTDQNTCGDQTIWYRFDVEGSGRLRFHLDVTSSAITTTSDIELYKQIVPGDSTAAGLQKIPFSYINANDNPDFPGSYGWNQACYTTGTYYLMVTGCSYPNATVIPRMWLIPNLGDFCDQNLTMDIDTAGSYQMNAVVDCWTIGESPGEDTNPMGCTGNPVGQKSGWFHINLDSPDKMDLDISLSENTTANSLQVKWRVANGSCDLMTFENCVDDGVFITLNLKCRQDSGLWIQVVMPESTTGDITLNVTATPALDQDCEPVDPFKPNANFDFIAGCVGEGIQFINQSSIGNNISYEWDFGDSSNVSFFENPVHTYAIADTYLVRLIVFNGMPGDVNFSSDTAFRQVVVYPIPVSLFSGPDTVYAGQAANFTNLSSNTLNVSTHYWDFCSGGGNCAATPNVYSGENPPPVIYDLPGTYQVCLTVTTGPCDSIYCRDLEVVFLEFFGGGPYDGYDDGIYSDCDTINFFTGGPFDGFDNEVDSDCDTISFFTGGPYDGFDSDVDSDCDTLNFFAGGPYDGFDSDVDSDCDTLNFFSGGPYDGFDEGLDDCVDTAQSIWAGGPYDGADAVEHLIDCDVMSIWAGGPYDGEGTMLREVQCNDINFFSGGPYDGFDEGQDTACEVINFFSGGPYDGFDKDGDSDCDTINFFSGGPYDGFDEVGDTACEDINFFSGGPYDGFDEGQDTACEDINFFSGGPYDGFDVISNGSIVGEDLSFCLGDSGTLVANQATNWYLTPVGGTPLAVDTNSYNTGPISQTTQYYIEDLCTGGPRVAVTAHVIDTLDAQFAATISCTGFASFFSNQTFFAGDNLPTIGVDITSYGTVGAPAGFGQLTVSDGSLSNFNFLTDGLYTGVAWYNNNPLAGTHWIQWNYFNPKSVTRINFGNLVSNVDKFPVAARLYYTDGGPWILVKAWDRETVRTGVFDSEFFCESQNIYARRWMLELDVEEMDAPYMTEFQVFANEPTTVGDIVWDYGNGITEIGNDPTYAYPDSGTFTVTMTLPTDCGCGNTASQTVYVPYCPPLSLIDQSLTAELIDDRFVALEWEVEGTFLQAELEKYVDGQWEVITVFLPDNPEIRQYPFNDMDPFYHKDNLYRVMALSEHGEQYSNQVMVRASLTQNQLNLYPNPTNGDLVNLSIKLTESAYVEVDLRNILGQFIRPIYKGDFEGSEILTLDVSDLAEGYYFIQVRINGIPEVMRLQVIR